MKSSTHKVFNCLINKQTFCFSFQFEVHHVASFTASIDSFVSAPLGACFHVLTGQNGFLISLKSLSLNLHKNPIKSFKTFYGTDRDSILVLWHHLSKCK